MTALLRVELTRLRWRRAVLVLLLLAVALPAAIGVARVWSTRPVTDEAIAQATRAHQDQIDACVAHPRRYGLDSSAERQCADTIVGWYTDRTPLSLARERFDGPGMGVVAILTATLLLAGATFAGHDWNSGSISNQLLFESRRGRVWVAKAAAVTGLALGVAATVSTAYWLAMWATMRVRGLPVADGGLSDALAYGLRGAGFAAAAALGGYALTMLLRSTVATLGALFAVAIAGGLLIGAVGLSEHWQPQKNVSAIVGNGTSYWIDVPASCSFQSRHGLPDDGSLCDPSRELTAMSGIGYFGTALLLVAGVSFATFRRRDVP